MPIRLNLLAEAHAEEELRRKDPVKRVVWVGILSVLLLLAWSSSLLLRTLFANGELNRVEAQLKNQTNAFTLAVANERKLADARMKLLALHRLATNRFLQAPVLNALQQATVNDVQLTRLRTDQSYSFMEATKPSTNSTGKSAAGKPASVTERITITLEARDTAARPGDQVAAFRQEITTHPFFRSLMGATNEARLASLAPPAPVQGKPSVQFSLECRIPERIR